MDKVYYHYVFRTYKGKSVLKAKEFVEYLKEVFNKISLDKGFPVLVIEILEDHAHLIIEQTKNDSTDYIMRIFKGGSARRFFQEYPSNRFEQRKLWGRGYYAEIIEESRLPGLVSYIKDQKNNDGMDKRYGTARFTRRFHEKQNA